MIDLNQQIQEPITVPETGQTLSDLPSGVLGVVCQLRGGKEFAGRMAALGFTIGAEVDVIQNSGRGAIIVVVRNTHVALGRAEAADAQKRRE